MRLDERPKSLLVASLKKPALAIPANPPTYSPKTTAAVNAVVAIRLSRRRTHGGVAPNNTPSVGRKAPFATALKFPRRGFQTSPKQ
jgi:hypothetical protein